MLVHHESTALASTMQVIDNAISPSKIILLKYYKINLVSAFKCIMYVIIPIVWVILVIFFVCGVKWRMVLDLIYLKKNAHRLTAILMTFIPWIWQYSLKFCNKHFYRLFLYGIYRIIVKKMIFYIIFTVTSYLYNASRCVL